VKFERGRFLVIGADPKKVAPQFGEIGREAVFGESRADLAEKLRQDPARFEIAVWFYPSGKSDDDRIAEELSRHADDVVLIAGAGAEVAERRPHLVECFGRFGLLPDYGCDLGGIDPGAICLRHHPGELEALFPVVETAFARLNRRLSALQRILRTRMTELEAAYRRA